MDIIKDRPIGVFDSGIGGLTVLEKLYEACPHEHYIYYADTKNLPYGEKTKDELIDIVRKIFDFYQQQDVKAVVMACNTSSALVYEELMDDYDFRIYPIIQITAECVAEMNLKRIGVLATNATVESHAYLKSLVEHDRMLLVKESACPLWVSMVEHKKEDYEDEDEDAIMLEYLEPILDFRPDKIILGCTHYPHLMNKIKRFARKSLFINPADRFSEYIKKDLENSGLRKTYGVLRTDFYVSSNPQAFKKNASVFIKMKDLPQLLEL